MVNKDVYIICCFLSNLVGVLCAILRGYVAILSTLKYREAFNKSLSTTTLLTFSVTTLRFSRAEKRLRRNTAKQRR